MPQLKDAPSEKYTFGGAGVLTDGIHGDFNYSNGCWLGFINTPLDATIDLGKTQTISQVKIGSLVQYSEYIFPPTQIKVYATNGDNPIKYRHGTEPKVKKVGFLSMKFLLTNDYYRNV